MRKKIRAGIALLMAGLTMIYAGGCKDEKAELEKEKLALQQRLEELQQQNASMKAEKESLQQQFDELNGLNQTVLDELKGLEATIYGPPLESGFYYDIPKGAFGSPYATDKVGLKSDRSRFDIDDVTLDFYIGAAYLDERYEEEYKKGFDIYFADRTDAYGTRYFVKHVDEPFTKEHEYKEITPSIEYDDFYRYEIEMEKYYTLTIPKELLHEEAGQIYIMFCFANAEDESLNGSSFFGAALYYKMEYGKVTISAKLFDEWKKTKR